MLHLRTDGDGIKILWVALLEFSVQPVFDYPGDRGTIDGDARSLEPFRVGDPRRIRVCMIPKGSLIFVNSSFRII